MTSTLLLSHEPIKLTDMVDLALGTPEVGSVNFNVLHTLLHAILSRLNIGDSLADIPEEDRQTLSSMEVLRRKSEVAAAAEKSPQLSSRPTPGDEDGGESIVTMDSGVTDIHTSPKSATAKSVSSASLVRTPYHALQDRLCALEKQLEALNSLPNNRDFMSEMFGGLMDKQQRMVSDMWQMVSSKKRIAANEEGIERLSSLLDDLMKEVANLSDENKRLKTRLTQMSDMTHVWDKITDLEKQIQALREQCDARIRGLSERLDLYPDPNSLKNLVTWDALESALRGIKEDMERLRQPPERIVINMATEPISRPVSARSVSSPGPSAALQEMLENLGVLTKKHDQLDGRVVKLENEMPNKADKKDLENLKLPTDLLQSIQDMRTQMDALMNLRNRDNEAMGRIREAINHLQRQMENLNNLVQKLMDESRSSLDRIEKLFNITTDHEDRKADVTYVDRKTEPKADLILLEGKVNYSLFDETTGDLHKLISDVLKKLLEAEEELRRLLAELGGNLDGKLDRGELDALRDWLEKRLRALAMKMKSTPVPATSDVEDDAAGLRRQLLQHFHCISCDRPLEIMPTGPFPSLPEKPGLAPNRSMRPYTVYELDTIRQHARSVGAEIIDLYQTPRPCGGTHTVTHPHKRITKVSASYAPVEEDNCDVQVTQPPKYHKEEIDIQGVDGHIYKGRLNQRGTTFYQYAVADDERLPPVRHAQKSDGPEKPKSARTSSTKPKQVTRFADQDGQSAVATTLLKASGGTKPMVHYPPPPSSINTVDDRGMGDITLEHPVTPVPQNGDEYLVTSVEEF